MSNETDRATPRPWAVCDDRPDGELCIVTGDEHRLPIALVDTQNTGDAQATADATLIVRSVNAHDALVDAASALLAELEPETRRPCDTLIARYWRPVAALRAALALAREVTK